MDKLTPNDGDLIAMIKSLIGEMPTIYDRVDRLEFNLNASSVEQMTKIAITEAIKGKLGKRLISCNLVDDNKKIIFFAKIDNYKDYPIEVREMLVEPEELAGTKYISRNLHVHALKIERENLENLLKFTGGGTMEIPRTSQGIAKYSFIDSFGTMVTALEGLYIVKLESGKFKIMSEPEFKENYYI